MINTVGNIGRTPTFKAVIVQKESLEENAPELYDEIQNGSLKTKLIGNFSAKDGVGKKLLLSEDGSKYSKLDTFFVLKSDETRSRRKERALQDTLVSCSGVYAQHYDDERIV